MMLFSNSLVLLVTLWSTNTFVASAIQEVDHQVRTSFDLRSNVHLTLEEQLFTADCLKLSFDKTAAELKSSDQVQMKQTDLKTAMRHPIATRQLNDAAGPEEAAAFKWIVNWHTQATCPHCHTTTTLHNALSHDLHKSWQSNFCEALRSGPFAVFLDVENCEIKSDMEINGALNFSSDGTSFMDEALMASEFATLKDNQQIVFNARASFGLPHDDDTTEEEQVFINECLRQAYDEIHDDEDIHMESADLKQHFTVPHEKAPTTVSTPLAAATRVGRPPNRWMDFTYSGIWSWQVTGVCNMCGLNLLLAHGMELEDGVKRNKKEQPRWEDSFCEKIRAGPFDKYKNVKNCYIAIFKEG